LGDEENRSRDILGRVYEYFLSQFASAEGKKGGEFYTPRCVVRLLVEMIEPYKGRVYDPCCGSSGMFVQSEEFIREHGGRLKDITILGQESNLTTWKLAKMNLAIRGIEADLGPQTRSETTYTRISRLISSSRTPLSI
jgi:type I restriction enzyme M protein